MASKTHILASLRAHLVTSFVIAVVFAILLLLGHYALDWGRQVKILLLLAGILAGSWCMLVFSVALTPAEELAEGHEPDPYGSSPFDERYL